MPSVRKYLKTSNPSQKISVRTHDIVVKSPLKKAPESRAARQNVRSDRFFWAIAIVSCAIGGSLMIVQVNKKLERNPVVITIAYRPTNIWSVPFPAVTICPGTQSIRSAFHYKKYHDLLHVHSGDLNYSHYKEWMAEKAKFMSIAVGHYLMIHSSNPERQVLPGFLEVIHDTSGYNFHLDRLGDMTPLLEQMFKCLFAGPLSLVKDNIDNSTWLNDTLEALYENSDFGKFADKYYPLWKEKVLKGVRCLDTLCYAAAPYKFRCNYSGYIDPNELDETDVDFLAKVGYNYTKSIQFTFNKQLEREGTTVRKTLTEQGVCHTFNMLDSSLLYSDQVVRYQHILGNVTLANEWTPGAGYSTANFDAFPRRPIGLGINKGLRINLVTRSEDVERLCEGFYPSNGWVGKNNGVSLEPAVAFYVFSSFPIKMTRSIPDFVDIFEQVVLHRPENRPQLLRDTVIIATHNKKVTVNILPHLTKTSSALRSYNPKERQCYFAGEKQLKYFKLYTRHNCDLECLTNATLRKCGCVALYMPRDNLTKLCGPAKLSCIEDTAGSIFEQEALKDMVNYAKQERDLSSSGSTNPDCDCLLPCIWTEYDAEVTNTDYPAEPDGKEKTDNVMYTTIDVFFKFKDFYTTERSELYGPVEFWANCGGVLGLFCGFSILSFIEFFYFFTIRLWINYLQRSNKKQRTPTSPGSKTKVFTVTPTTFEFVR